MKKIAVPLLLAAILLSGCSFPGQKAIENETGSGHESAKSNNRPYQYIDKSGQTLQTRIKEPQGYSRIEASSGSLLEFTRNLKLKPDGSPVMLHDGKKKANQSAQIAVFDLDVGSADLQQCADSVMRIYGEYLWSVGAYDDIKFHLTSGFLMEYTKWQEGNRLEVSGNDVRWVKRGGYDNTYESFRRYLNQVYVYAGTMSLYKESSAIELEDIEAGDMFIKGGSPGHVVMVLDIAQDEKGSKCFLLGQGYMPAQDFHILKNPLHPDDPWYYSSEVKYPLRTPEYSFEDGSLRRWGAFN